MEISLPPPNQSQLQNSQPGQPVNSQPSPQPLPSQFVPVQQQANPQPPTFDQSYQAPPPGQYLQQSGPTLQAMSCYVCGGNGQALNEKVIICKECNWLRPLVPGYRVDASTFEWAADGKAMSALRSMKTLNSAARAVSEKVGRRWIEVTFNGVLLGEKQLPNIYGQAVRAARILGMSHMPDVYLSGEQPWDCLTFGSNPIHSSSLALLWLAISRDRISCFCLAARWDTAAPDTRSGKP